MGFFSKKGAETNDRTGQIEAFRKKSDDWNFEKIKVYLRGKDEQNELSDIGIAAIIERFIHARKNDSRAPGGKRREFELHDQISRTKMGLDIVLAMMSNKVTTPETLDSFQHFIAAYQDVIDDLDKKLSQTYMHKLKETFKNAQVAALTKSQISRSLDKSY